MDLSEIMRAVEINPEWSSWRCAIFGPSWSCGSLTVAFDRDYKYYQGEIGTGYTYGVQQISLYSAHFFLLLGLYKCKQIM